ncbi:hypothetical protein [Fidelibacter multiformis]|jgi:hypothetical protein|uniref:hypothetical protein n=1 Tax=Fidelibacter multiformis TaxID=3377529 RepID=UPI0037DC802E
MMILQDKLFLALLLFVTTFCLFYGLIPAFRRRFVFLPLLSFLILLLTTLFLTLPGSLKNPVLSYTLYNYDILLFKLTISRLIFFSLVFLTLLITGMYNRHSPKDEILVCALFISLFLFSGNIFTAFTGVLFILLSWFGIALFSSSSLRMKIQKLGCFYTHPPNAQYHTGHKYKQDTPVIGILTLYFLLSFIILMIGFVTG